MKFLKLMRVKHYIKNLLIFLPIVFSGRLPEGALLLRNLYALLSFSFLSSVIYVVNDILDVSKDRMHPTKRFRPIAAGDVSVSAALLLSALLLALVAALNLLCDAGWASWAVLGVYLLINLVYSFGLKNIPIVDIAILAAGFLLRLLYGSAITGIEISNWLALTVISMAFYLGMGKRRNELMRMDGHTSRAVLQHYNKSFLDRSMNMCLTLAIIFYALWSVDAATMERTGSGALVWTVPLVLLICFKYSLVIEGQSDGDPVEVLLKDKILLLLVGGFALLLVGILYF